MYIADMTKSTNMLNKNTQGAKKVKPITSSNYLTIHATKSLVLPKAKN